MYSNHLWSWKPQIFHLSVVNLNPAMEHHHIRCAYRYFVRPTSRSLSCHFDSRLLKHALTTKEVPYK